MTTTTQGLPTVAPDFAVYVHWPFCLSKCPYCDFNSHVRHGGYDEASYASAIQSEIAAAAARAPGRTVSTIFFGGGTPSLMQPSTVEAILNSIGKHWTVAQDVEVSLEANPTSVEATRFRGYHTAGVNRVSLGVQALDDAALKELGRLHTAQEALDAIAVARSIFDRYSFDLIYARPHQTTDTWSAELKRAIAEAAEHLSLYQLTIEPDTPFFGLHKAGKLLVPDDELGRDLYDLTQTICAGAGLPAYEVSNHARPRNAGIIWSTGAATNMPASDRAHMAGSISTDAATPPKPRSGRKTGWSASRRRATGSSSTRNCNPAKWRTNIC
jgi:putative oxygen-independent coproporphyrinogen III oxidase